MRHQRRDESYPSVGAGGGMGKGEGNGLIGGDCALSGRVESQAGERSNCDVVGACVRSEDIYEENGEMG